MKRRLDQWEAKAREALEDGAENALSVSAYMFFLRRESRHATR